MRAKAAWMQPGAPRVAKPSWLRVQPYVPTAPPAPHVAATMIEVLPSIPPVRSIRPSIPPPSRRMPPAQIQTTRELELEGELVALESELQRVRSEVETMRARVLAESEPEILALAVAIARRVIGREVAADPALLRRWIAEARGALPGAVAFLAPDVAAEGDVVDPSLPAGSAELRDGASTIAISAEARTAALADALGVES